MTSRARSPRSHCDVIRYSAGYAHRYGRTNVCMDTLPHLIYKDNKDSFTYKYINFCKNWLTWLKYKTSVTFLNTLYIYYQNLFFPIISKPKQSLSGTLFYSIVCLASYLHSHIHRTNIHFLPSFLWLFCSFLSLVSYKPHSTICSSIPRLSDARSQVIVNKKKILSEESDLSITTNMYWSMHVQWIVQMSHLGKCKIISANTVIKHH